MTAPAPEREKGERAFRKAFLDLYIECEEIAVNGYADYQGDGRWVFNDAEWRRGDTESGFRIAMAARRALGLKPLKIDRTSAPSSWPKHRSAEELRTAITPTANREGRRE